jgi:Cysteine rich repeat
MTRTLCLLATLVLFLMGTIASIAHAQSDMMNAILVRLTGEIKKLEASCSEDIKKYCSTVTPGEGRILHCMQAHEDKISPQCAYDLNEVELLVYETSDDLRDAVNACRGDIEKLCANTQPGQGRIAACLAANSGSASQNCLAAVRKLQPK